MIRKLTHEELLCQRAFEKRSSRFPIFALLNNVRSLYNVGSIFRTADGANVAELYLAGITATPPNPRIQKTALGAERTVPWSYTVSPAKTLADLRRAGTEILVLEQAEHSEPLSTAAVRFPCCLVVGNEISGVDETLAAHADRAVEIPMYGMKNSLNVAVAFGVAVYTLVNRYLETQAVSHTPERAHS